MKLKNVWINFFLLFFPVTVYGAVAGQPGLKAVADLPFQAQAEVSAAIGRDNPSFHLARTAGGYRGEARNRGMVAEFGAEGVRIGGWRLSPVGVGRGGLMSAPSPARPHAGSNRVEYRRGAMTEWYVNGPLGIEQGFTFAVPPQAGKTGELLIMLKLPDGFAASISGDGTGLTLRRPDGEPVLSYSGLTAWDAGGRAIQARLGAQGDKLVLRVDDRDAQYPITVDPMVQQAGLSAPQAEINDFFGCAVALSSNGSTALVGAYGEQVGGNTFQGAAYVFTRTGAVWSQQQRLVADDGTARDGFGWSVALSSDGSTALIGSYGLAVGGNPFQGAAYVFARTGATWSLQQKLTAADGAANDYFGWSAALSGDGSTALVGAYWKTVGANSAQGSAYVFTRTGTVWSQQQKLAGADGAAGDLFGVSVALSSDGATALVGAYEKNVGGNLNQGSAYVFNRSGAVWSQQQKLTAADGSSDDFFGSSVALSSNGDTALVGAVDKEINGNTYQGSAYVFTRSGVVWSQQQELTAADGAPDDYFGSSVALGSDGSTALVGAYGKTVGGNAYQGSAFLFTRTGAAWSQQQVLAATDGSANDYFGSAAVLRSDSSMALVGAYWKTVGANAGQGSAYVYAIPGFPSAVTSSATNFTVSGATLNGIVNANNIAASVTFEYGATSAYGSTATASPATVTGSADTAATAAIGNLSPGSSYHFRVVAGNAAGTSRGLDKTFTTANPPYALHIHVGGTGSGGVLYAATSAVCENDCTLQISGGANVILKTTDMDQYSLFSGWSGACINSTGDCVFTMSGAKDVTATFNLDMADAVQLDLPKAGKYSSISAAYAQAVSNASIKTWGIYFPENINFASAKSVTLKGGYNAGFTSNTGGMTTVLGPMTIAGGTVFIENIVVK